MYPKRKRDCERPQTVGNEFAASQQMINTGSTKREVKRFVFRGK